MTNPYVDGLELVKKNSGTSGQAALAKCILSLYNPIHYFGAGEILSPLDANYTRVVMDMMIAYSEHGETEELCMAGSYVYENFPRLVEMSEAMQQARADVRKVWDRQREEENARLYPNG